MKCLSGYCVEFGCPVQSYIDLLLRAMQALEAEKCTYDNSFRRCYRHSRRCHHNVGWREHTSDCRKWTRPTCNRCCLKIGITKKSSSHTTNTPKLAKTTKACSPQLDSSLPSVQSGAPSQIHFRWMHLLLSVHSHSFLRHFGGGGVGLVVPRNRKKIETYAIVDSWSL